jgi:Flp pilus assembly pilin Flp
MKMEYNWTDYYGNGFWQEEEGVGVVEIVLILVVLVALVLVFKDNVADLVKKAFNNVNGNRDTIQKTIDSNVPN